jgi:hypothetical protein
MRGLGRAHGAAVLVVRMARSVRIRRRLRRDDRLPALPAAVCLGPYGRSARSRSSTGASVPNVRRQRRPGSVPQRDGRVLPLLQLQSSLGRAETSSGRNNPGPVPSAHRLAEPGRRQDSLIALVLSHAQSARKELPTLPMRDKSGLNAPRGNRRKLHCPRYNSEGSKSSSVGTCRPPGQTVWLTDEAFQHGGLTIDGGAPGFIGHSSRCREPQDVA